MSEQRTYLQRESNRIDADLTGVVKAIEQLAERIPVAGSKLRRIAIRLDLLRPELRAFMHQHDREVTR